MQTVRVPVGRVPQIKHTCEGRKIPFIKNTCNNFDRKKKLKRIQRTEIKFNEVQEINHKDKRQDECNNIYNNRKRVHNRQNDRLKLANK
jgi:hypothetical protein